MRTRDERKAIFEIIPTSFCRQNKSSFCERSDRFLYVHTRQSYVQTKQLKIIMKRFFFSTLHSLYKYLQLYYSRERKKNFVHESKYENILRDKSIIFVFV